MVRQKNKMLECRQKQPVNNFEEEIRSFQTFQMPTTRLVDVIAVVFKVNDEKHPFYSINGVTGSVELEHIIGYNDTIKNEDVSFG